MEFTSGTEIFPKSILRRWHKNKKYEAKKFILGLQQTLTHYAEYQIFEDTIKNT